MKGGRWIGPAIGVILLIAFLLMPPIAPLTPLGMKVVGIFLFTVIWWVTVGIGYPSLLCVALIALTGVMTPTEAFATSWGNWIVLFLIGIMGLSGGLQVTGFCRRFALWFISLPFVAGRPWMLVAMFFLACTLLGMVTSLTVNCIVFMAIATPILKELGYKKGDDFSAMLMMGIAWASTASFVATPIASAGNVMMINWVQRDFGYNISFSQWLLWGVPMGLLVFGILFLLYRYVVRPDVSKIASAATAYLEETKAEMGAMTLKEKIALGVFLVVILIWIFPDFGRFILPGVSDYLGGLGRAVPALVGACLLCLIRVRKQPILRFNQWMSEFMEWSAVALIAAIAVLGNVISDPGTGIPQLLTDVFRPMVGAPVYVFLLISFGWVILQTNVMSNIVSMTLVYTVLAPVAASYPDINVVALAVGLAASSNLAFALPSATTSTAIVVGSGWVPVSFLARYGAVSVIPLILLFAFVGYPYACLIFS